jgi:hypothetical protein
MHCLISLYQRHCPHILIKTRRHCSIEQFASYLEIYLYIHLATVQSLNSTYYSQYYKNFFCVRQCPFFLPVLSVGETMGTTWQEYRWTVKQFIDLCAGLYTTVHTWKHGGRGGGKKMVLREQVHSAIAQ